MVYFISIIHALTCIFIVLFILLQDPKGGVLGSLGGGGSNKSFFGSEGASPFLVSVTKWLAIIFACSSFYLSYMSSKTGSVMEKTGIEQKLPQPTTGHSPEQTDSPTKAESPKKQEDSPSNQ
ncbi:MAG: preprotein translocase subunit SecG [Oligoflexia bacterium]|nr:preprotein translocase subunit SecG [Oligoflexia bacterium]